MSDSWTDHKKFDITYLILPNYVGIFKTLEFLTKYADVVTLFDRIISEVKKLEKINRKIICSTFVSIIYFELKRPIDHIAYSHSFLVLHSVQTS